MQIGDFVVVRAKGTPFPIVVRVISDCMDYQQGTDSNFDWLVKVRKVEIIYTNSAFDARGYMQTCAEISNPTELEKEINTWKNNG